MDCTLIDNAKGEYVRRAMKKKEFIEVLIKSYTITKLKTRVGTNCIKCFVNKYPFLKVLVVVPTVALKDQWESILDNLGLSFNCEVSVINTVIKHQYIVDLLVIDEVQRVPTATFEAVFNVVKYKFILGLTATFERLDGKHKILEKYCPVFDTITVEEARQNGWISNYKEYKVILNVDDIATYKSLNREFQKHFEYFNYSWELISSLVGTNGFRNRLKLRDQMCTEESEKKKVLNEITYHAVQAMKIMQKRKAFINNHPKKIEITRKIIDARTNKKIITFSNNIKMAESIERGEVYSGKTSKNKSKTMIQDFSNVEFGVLNTINKVNEGLDCKGLSVAIFLGIDSSKLKKIQRSGRVLRVEPGKEAEIFVLVINDTQETKWAINSNTSNDVITIDEKGLDDVLANITPKPYKRKISEFTFRY